MKALISVALMMAPLAARASELKCHSISNEVTGHLVFDDGPGGRDFASLKISNKDTDTERSVIYHHVTVGTELDLDMKFGRLARLELSLEAAKGVTYELLEQENAACKIESIRTESFGVLVDVSFDPELEDGLNACTVALNQANASKTLITLFQIVDDGETKLYTKSLRTLDQDYSIDMQNHDSVWLILKGEAGIAGINAEIGETNMANCKVQSIKQVGENVVVLVDFEAELEDGLNNCIVEISNASFTSRVELFQKIIL